MIIAVVCLCSPREGETMMIEEKRKQPGQKFDGTDVPHKDVNEEIFVTNGVKCKDVPGITTASG